MCCFFGGVVFLGVGALSLSLSLPPPPPPFKTAVVSKFVSLVKLLDDSNLTGFTCLICHVTNTANTGRPAGSQRTDLVRRGAAGKRWITMVETSV